MYQLVAKTGGRRGTNWPLGESPLVIGRASTCDVVIAEDWVSRRHCELQVDGDALRLLTHT